MSNAIYFGSGKLKKEASVPDFLVAMDELANRYISKRKGFLSLMLLNDGDTWADLCIFETMEDLKNFIKPSVLDELYENTSELREKYYSFWDFNVGTSHLFSVERNYQFKSTVPKVVTFVSYKLKKGVTVSDFLLVADKAGNRPPFEGSVTISWKLLVDNDLWADLLCWESMEGPKNAASSENENPAIKEYLSMIGEVPFHGHFTVVVQ